MLNRIFLAIIFSVFCANAYAKDSRFYRIEMHADHVVIHFNKKVSEGKTSLVPTGTNKHIQPKYFNKRRVVFPMAGTNGSECFRIKVKSKYWSPTNKSSSENWCFKNPQRAKVLAKREEIIEVKNEIENISNSLLIEKSVYDDNILKKSSYSDECRYPQPIIPPKPATFCSNSEKLTAKRNQCYAPLLKAACTYSVYELTDMEKYDAERLGVPLACLQAANSLVNKEATVGDVLTAGSQSVFMSKTGIKGFLGNLFSFTIAAASHDRCVARLNSQCFPKAPPPPDCSAWKQYEISQSNSFRYLSKLEGNVNILNRDLNLLENDLVAIENKTLVEKF